LLAMLRLDNGSVRSLRGAIATLAGLDYQAILEAPGARYAGPMPPFLADPAMPPHTPSDGLRRLQPAAPAVLAHPSCRTGNPTAIDEIVTQQLGTPDAEVSRTLRFACEVIVPRLERTPDEIANIVRALQGEYVPAGPSGAPTRGLAHVLPTGRNFYSVDPKALPSQIAYQVGTDLANGLLASYLTEDGTYPQPE